MTQGIKRKIIIGVSASIAAYRSCELVRNLVKQDYPVQVIQTADSVKLIGSQTFEALTGNPVYIHVWDEAMTHIELKRMAGVFAVVPATANMIGKFASGIADDLLSTTYLSVECPVLMAPAMNPAMYKHPATQRNIQTLLHDGVEILDPTDGEVVCGDVGQGKLAPVALIEERIIKAWQLYGSKTI